MIYVLGDSNAVATAERLPDAMATSACERGQTSEWVKNKLDAILRAWKKPTTQHKHSLDPKLATAFLVFVGMNDAKFDVPTIQYVTAIVEALAAARNDASVSVFVALPFCAQPGDPTCATRRTAAAEIRKLGANSALRNVVIVDVHVDKDNSLHPRLRSDALHMTDKGYEKIAAHVVRLAKRTSSGSKGPPAPLPARPRRSTRSSMPASPPPLRTRDATRQRVAAPPKK